MPLDQHLNNGERGSSVGRSPRTPRVRAAARASPYARSSGKAAAPARHGLNGAAEEAGAGKSFAQSPFGPSALALRARTSDPNASAKKLDLSAPVRNPSLRRARTEDVEIAKEVAKSPSMFASLLSLISPNRSSQKERSAAFGSDIDPSEDAERKANISASWETTTRTRRTSATVLPDQGTSSLSDEPEAGPSTASPNKLYPPLSEPSKRLHSPDGHGSKLRGALFQPKPSLPNAIQGSKTFASFGRQALASSSMAQDPAGPSDLRRSETARGAFSSPTRTQEDDPETRLTTWMDTTPDASRLLAEEEVPEYSPNRNYSLLAQFFAEKSGSSDANAQPLTEVEIAGCLKLMEECADHGRDLESEIGQIEARHRTAAEIAGGLNESPSIRSSFSAAGLHDSSLFQYPEPHSIHHSQSFLSPYNVSQKVKSSTAARSAALAAQNGSPVRRSRRVVYLGPGLSSRAASSPRLNLGAKTRAAVAPARAAMTQSIPTTATAKRQRREEAMPREDMDTRDDDDAPPSASLVAENTTPFSFTSPIPTFSNKMDVASRSPAAQNVPPVSVPPTSSQSQAASTSTSRATLTSSILRDIIKENPLPASPRAKPAMDLTNPYQSGTGPATSAGTDRSPAAPSPRASRANKESITERMARARATAALNAKRKEEEIGAKKKDTLVEAIERTAAESPGRKRVNAEEHAEAKAQESNTSGKSRGSALQTAPANEQGKVSFVARSEESKPSSDGAELNSLSPSSRREQDKKTQAPQKQQTQPEKPPSAESISSSSKPKPSTQPSNGNGAASSGSGLTFTLPAKYAASAPKKRSPLSTTVSAVPDSPESDKDSRLKNNSAVATAKLSAQPTTKNGPAPLFSLAPKSADTTASQPTPATPDPSQSSFSFSMPTAQEPSKPSFAQPASQPDVPKPAALSASPVSQEGTKDKALKELPNNLPSYDFALPARVNEAMLSAAERAARDAALALVPKSLPTFKFSESSLEAASGTATPMSHLSSSIVSRSTSATPAAPAINGEPTEDEAQSGEIAAKDREVGQGEEDESTEHEVRAKAWKKEADSWKDVGVGMLKLKRNNASGKRRMLMRSEGNGNVLINFSLFQGLTARQEKTQVVFMGFDGAEMKNFRIKIKSADEATELKEAIQREAAQS